LPELPLAQPSQVKEHALQVNSTSLQEAQKELQRLREELFRCRRSETQKERENVFLQQQLMEAAAKINEFSASGDLRSGTASGGGGTGGGGGLGASGKGASGGGSSSLNRSFQRI
jgi:hypothetical protein